MCKPVDEIIIRHSERAGYIRLTQQNAILKHFPDVKENIKNKTFFTVPNAQTKKFVSVRQFV